MWPLLAAVFWKVDQKFLESVDQIWHQVVYLPQFRNVVRVCRHLLAQTHAHDQELFPAKRVDGLALLQDHVHGGGCGRR